MGSVSNRKSLNAGHLPALDGLRAIAILLVLLYHFTPDRNSNQGFRAILFKIADLGWSGVDLFFVLSGFLVTSLLLKVKRGEGTLYEFLLRRAFRIVPCYFAALLLVFFIFPVLSDAYPVASAGVQLPLWLFVSNYVEQIADFSEGRFIVGHFWSLGVEAQFYLLWPLVILRFGTRGVVRFCAIMIAFAVSGRLALTLLEAHWTTTFAWLPFRIDCLLGGALVALHFDGRSAQAPISSNWAWYAVLGSSLILGGVAWFGLGNAVFKAPENTIFGVVRVFLPNLLFVFYGSLLVLALHRNWLSMLLSAPVFAPLAKYSYSLYVVHYLIMPVLFREIELFVSPNIGGDVRIYVVSATAFMVVYLFSVLSYHIIEKPFVVYGASFSKRVRGARQIQSS